MDREAFLRDYWAYYIMLEDKFIHTLNYVELSEDNFNTHSNEYAALMQMIGGELDSFFKIYCGFDPNAFKRINDYYDYLMTDYPDILNQKISVRSADISPFQPFLGWDGARAKQSLAWWAAFDNIKHSRSVNKRDANQKNVLYLLGALFLLEMKYIKNIVAGTRKRDIPDETSKLFELVDWQTRFSKLGEGLYSERIFDFSTTEIVGPNN